MKPTMTPIGRRFPPDNELERTIGKTGKIHGDKIVTTPAMKEKIMSTITLSNCSDNRLPSQTRLGNII